MKFVRFSQVPPAPLAGPGMPPIGGVPAGVPTTPMAMPTEPPKRSEVAGPLNSLAKVLYDIDITNLIENSTGSSPEELAMDIWIKYGGNEKGGVQQGCVGTRRDSTTEPTPEELKLSDKKRWQRLPAGKTIADITSLEELSKIMNGLVLGTVKNTAKQQGGGPGGPGGPPPALASKKHFFTRLASIFDDLSMYENADEITFLTVQSR